MGYQKYYLIRINHDPRSSTTNGASSQMETKDLRSGKCQSGASFISKTEQGSEGDSLVPEQLSKTNNHK